MKICRLLFKMPFMRSKKGRTAADRAAVQTFVALLTDAPGAYAEGDELYRRFIATTDRVRLDYASFLAALKLLRPGKVFEYCGQAVLLDAGFGRHSMV